MKLKTVTLLAAIAQLLALLCSLYNTVHLATRIKLAENVDWLLTTPFFLLAQIMLMVLLFSLAGRQQAA